MNEIGSCHAIIKGIRTNVDGSVLVSLELNPDEKEILMKLMGLFADNKKYVTVGFVSLDE